MIILFALLQITTTAFVLRPPLQQQQHQQLLLPYSPPNRRHTHQQREKPSWLEDAMGANNDDFQGNSDKKGSKQLDVAPGISGFAIDPKQGFVAILSSAEDNENERRYISTIVSPQDTGDQLVSPEALTMVQLAGGLDLGTAILPPDALTQLAIDELDDDEDEEENLSRPLVTLTKILVLPNDDIAVNNVDNSKISSSDTNTITPSTPERDEAIQESSTKVFQAIQKLPGLAQVTIEKVQIAMRCHADSDGNLNRDAFTNVLTSLRQDLNARPVAKYKFILQVNVIGKDSINTLEISTIDSVKALGLSMRHKVQVQIDPNCFSQEEGDGHDDGASIATIENISAEYPAFRPVQELYEDAKVMDGFIPSMFQQAKKQQRQSDDDIGGSEFE